MAGHHILALDQGTTSSRALVFDTSGSVVGTAQQEFTQHFPRPGWVEHDPEEIWTTQLETARAAIEKAGLMASDLAGIGITNQRETVVVWDRETGEPIHHAIVWQDRRTTDTINRLKAEGCEPDVTSRTGLVLDPYFSATKIAWILDHVDGARARAEKGELACGTIDTWLIYKLTTGRVHATDVTNASRTLLYNIHDLAWDETLLDLFKIPVSLLPDVHPSSAAIAESDLHVLGTSLPIAGIAGDQQAALFGQLCSKPGMAKNTYGTGCFMLLQTGEVPVASTSKLLTTAAWQLDEEPCHYALEGSVFVGGAAIQWLRDGLGIIKSAPEVNDLAAQAGNTGGVYVVPAFVGLGAPRWDPNARGTIVGITRGTTAAEICRATLASIAFQVTDVLQAMQQDTGEALAELRVDGGAAASDLLLQMQADLLGIPVQRPKLTETTALGAAYLAGLSVGLWPDLESLDVHREVERTFEPAISDEEREIELEQWHKAVERSMNWAS